MHGIIFSELRKFIDANMGSTGWEKVMVDSGIGRKMYLPIQEYPDGDMFALVTTASKTLGVPAETILEKFGTFIAPSLLGLYRTLVKPEWKTLDLLENTENTIHTVVRARNRGAKPAQLQVVRTGPDTVDLTYYSERKLCPVAKGIIKGLAAHFQEEVTVTEKVCMHNGGDACRMEVRVVAAAAPTVEPAEAAKVKKRRAKAAVAAV